MKVNLRRPISTPVGVYYPDPSGTVVPDSLRDFIKSIVDAEILEDAPFVPDPDVAPSAGSFVAHFDGTKPQAKRSTKANPIV